jgi:hypothetical protein
MRLLLFLVPLLFLPQEKKQDDVIIVGRENWEKPWIPDLKKPETKIPIPEAKRIDVLILPDGYLATERDAFEKDVKDWYERFLTYTPWKQFRGAFRVRGYWRPSDARSNADRKSRFAIPVGSSGVGDVNTKEVRTALFGELGKLDFNTAGDKRYSHAVAVILMKDDRGRNPSGLTRSLSSPDDKHAIPVCFAAYTHHEFGHGYGGLRDEYINKPGEKSSKKQAATINLWTVENIATTKELKSLPWAHLAPGTALNPDKQSVVGICWIGGGAEEGAWHCEGRCLMNGTHENWDFQKTKRGAGLRDHDRFCFWCEELVVARTLARTGQLGDATDGEALWKKWEELRPLYHKSFDVAGRIKAQNEANVKAKLTDAKIFERPTP